MHAKPGLFNGKALDDIISAFPTPAHLKDSTTGKYIYTNKANLAFYNLNEVKELVGYTVKDLNGFMQPYWGGGFAKEVEALEYSVINKKEKMVDIRTILLPCGKLMIQHMEKTPIIDSNGEASSILTMSRDLSVDLSLAELFNLYKKHLTKTDKNLFIRGVLKHLGLDEYFTSLPTEGELRVLLAQRNLYSYIEVAKVLGLSLNSVKKYVVELRKKVKNYDLVRTLVALRSLRQYW